MPAWSAGWPAGWPRTTAAGTSWGPTARAASRRTSAGGCSRRRRCARGRRPPARTRAAAPAPGPSWASSRGGTSTSTRSPPSPASRAARTGQTRTRSSWRDDPAGLAAWREGRTGFPVVDAAMRQLAATGWMHNRARMVVASFLVKDLLVDWREGERHFMRLLVDGDVASNAGGWQWIAACGPDAQPWFRILDPVAQGRRFDPDGAYVRRWVPELAGLPDRVVHAPWDGGRGGAPLRRGAAGPRLPRADRGPADVARPRARRVGRGAPAADLSCRRRRGRPQRRRRAPVRTPPPRVRDATGTASAADGRRRSCRTAPKTGSCAASSAMSAANPSALVGCAR